MQIDHAPTKGNLQQLQKSLQLSKNGYTLMDRKRMILINEISSLMKEANTIQEKLDAAVKEAYHILDIADADMGLIQMYNAALDVPIDDSLKIQIRSIMGTEVPNVKYDEQSIEPAYALATTSAYLDKARLAFEKVKALQFQLAQIENAAYRLAANIKKTKKRVNALQNITLPALQGVEREISSALEEKEREEFIRLKVVKRILNEKAASV
ncbi:MAG: V-type ATP synthase subunit D [Aerococcus sp.]|nr:V-type ATP synthase subunit D [Aerococcus sp.]